jgi:hypothetical protein
MDGRRSVETVVEGVEEEGAGAGAGASFDEVMGALVRCARVPGFERRSGCCVATR